MFVIVRNKLNFIDQRSDSLAKGLVDTAKIEKHMENKQKMVQNPQVKKSPSKRAQRRNRRRSGIRNYVEMDSDSDSDSPIAPNATTDHVHRRAQPHDPNTIVLDCDDDFKGGPAVTFTRDVAGANAVSIEQTQEMKVSVRINTKIVQFQMNPVSGENKNA